MERVEYEPNECDPVALTQRLHVANTIRNNLRTKSVEATGKIPATPMLDSQIEWLENALATHLPGFPTG